MESEERRFAPGEADKRSVGVAVGRIRGLVIPHLVRARGLLLPAIDIVDELIHALIDEERMDDLPVDNPRLVARHRRVRG